MHRDQGLIQRYCERAAHFRAIAEGVSEEEERALLMKLAQDYDALAESVRKMDRTNRPFTDP